MVKDYLLRAIEDELWKKVKKLCIDRNITARQLIISLLEKEVEEEPK